MRFREGVALEELALELSDAPSATLLAALELHDKEALEVQQIMGQRVYDWRKSKIISHNKSGTVPKGAVPLLFFLSRRLGG